MNRIKRMLSRLLFYSWSSEEIIRVKDKITLENAHYVRIWSFIESIYWLFCIVMSFFQADYRVCRSVYVFAMTVCLGAFIISLVIPKIRNKKLWVRISAVLVGFALLSAGTFIACILAPKTIVIFAAPLIVPVMFINDTMWTIVVLMLNILLFALCGARLDYETYTWVLVNQIIFSSIGVMLGHFVNKARFERYAFAEAAIELAELRAQYAYYDSLTGLLNRRAYEEQVGKLCEDLPEDCWVVVVDINGLKEINDTRGHKAGDELIVGTAKCLHEGFSDTEYIYRMGGDEFCIISVGSESSIFDRLEKLVKTGETWSGELISGISLSYGIAKINDYEILSDAFKMADKHMYDSKREYYANSEHDRRAR